MALSVYEKLELIDKLWESIEPNEEHIEISKEEKRLLDDHWANYKKNPGAALTIEQVKVLVRERMRERRTH